jgi:hypothetical protein
VHNSLVGVSGVHAQTDVWQTGSHGKSAASVGFVWHSRYLPGWSSTGLLGRALGAFTGTRAPTAQVVPEWMGLDASVLSTICRSFRSTWLPVPACPPPPGSVCFNLSRPTSGASLVGAFLEASTCVFGGPTTERVRQGGVPSACSGASPEAGLREGTPKAGHPEAGNTATAEPAAVMKEQQESPARCQVRTEPTADMDSRGPCQSKGLRAGGGAVGSRGRERTAEKKGPRHFCRPAAEQRVEVECKRLTDARRPRKQTMERMKRG